MSPVVKYSLARVGLFAVIAVILVLAPIGLSFFLRLAIALLISAALSWFLLKGMRNAVANDLASAAERRAQRREKLRSALAGEDETTTQ